MSTTNINSNTLYEWSLNGGRELLAKIQEWGLIPHELSCPRGHKMTICGDNLDTMRWRCYSKCKLYEKTKPVSCQYAQSITSNTFFHKSKLSVVQVLQFVFFWLMNIELVHIERLVLISKPTAIDWSSFCRKVVFDAMISRKQQIGGPGKTVEIDESKFGRRKLHRGRPVDVQWVFGGIERESGECFLVPVERRDRETLVPIIKTWIAPGSTVVSGHSEAYDTLGDEGYHHLKVNHSINFVDPETGANTNRIEATWRAAKMTFKSSGQRKSFLAGYLAKYMFLKRCKLSDSDPFLEFLHCAGSLYNPSCPRHITSEDSE